MRLPRLFPVSLKQNQEALQGLSFIPHVALINQTDFIRLCACVVCVWVILGGVFFVIVVRIQHPRCAAAAAAAALPLCSLSSRMPDMQTEAGATILKYSTA